MSRVDLAAEGHSLHRSAKLQSVGQGGPLLFPAIRCQTDDGRILPDSVDEPAQQMRPQLTVIHLNGESLNKTKGISVGQSFVLTKDVVTFGRHEENDIPLFAFDKVRQHGCLIKDGEDYWIQDTSDARYPVLVNGIPIGDGITLRDGDEITVLKVKFLYQKPSASKENSPHVSEER